MTFSATTIKTAAAAAALAAAGVLTATTASANPDIVPFGHMAALSGAGGSEVTHYTVSNLRPTGNNDGVWFADVTVMSGKGTVTPIVGDFNARAANGASYTVMEGTQPDGLTNQPISPGGSAGGRIYFPVGAGTAPDSVVYSTGAGADQIIWKG